MSPEVEAFQTWRDRPGRETAANLIRSQQDRVYNICFQILRHGSDAEDAAQEVLLELLAAAPHVADADHWRRSVYRIAFRSAIDHKRARLRRETHERARAAMTSAPSGTESFDASGAIPEAMAQLDEESRNLVLAHYFEKSTLEELGRRHGCSTSAIWKRLAGAREELKRALAVSGFAALGSRAEACLESIEPVQAPAHLISTALLAKAAPATSAAAGTGAALTLGGALVAFIVGTASTYQLAGERPPVSGSAPPIVGSASAASNGELPKQVGSARPGALVKGGSDVAVAAAKPNSLMEKLVEFRHWIADRAPITDRETWIELNRRTSEVHEPSLQESGTFLPFIKSPESVAHWGLLIRILFPEKGDDAISGRQVKFAKFPGEIVTYLKVLLEQGSPKEKREVLNLVGKFDDPGDAFRALYGRLLQDPDPEIRRVALMRLSLEDSADLSEHFATVRQMMAQATKVYETTGCIHALTRMESAEAEDFLLAKLVENRDPELLNEFCHVIQEKIRKDEPERRIRYVQAAESLLNIRLDRKQFSSVVWLYLKFPLEDAAPLLEKAKTCAPEPGLAEAVSTMLAKIRAGETRIEQITKGFGSE